MRDEHVDDLIDLYALGALEPDEQSAVDEHLDECAQCRARLEQAKELVLLLAWTPDQHDPPPALRGRVMRRVRQLQHLDGDGGVSWWQRLVAQLQHGTPRLALGFATVATVLALAFGARTVQLQGEIAQLSGQLRSQQEIVDLLRGRDSQLVALQAQNNGGSGQAHLLLDPSETRAYLVTDGLAPLPANQTYQLWLIGGTTPVSMGTFAVDSRGVATIVVQSDRPLQQFDAVGVSVEPAGGSPQPTNVVLLNQL